MRTIKALNKALRARGLDVSAISKAHKKMPGHLTDEIQNGIIPTIHGGYYDPARQDTRWSESIVDTEQKR